MLSSDSPSIVVPAPPGVDGPVGTAKINVHNSLEQVSLRGRIA